MVPCRPASVDISNIQPKLVRMIEFARYQRLKTKLVPEKGLGLIDTNVISLCFLTLFLKKEKVHKKDSKNHGDSWTMPYFIGQYALHHIPRALTPKISTIQITMIDN